MEGGFFGGGIIRFCYFIKTRSVFYPIPDRFNPCGRGSFKTDDLFFNRLSFAHKRTAAGQVFFALQILGNIKVGEASVRARNVRYLLPQVVNGSCRRLRSIGGFCIKQGRQRRYPLLRHRVFTKKRRKLRIQ
ncbi:MAG: hypothetical protein NTY93_01495 [Candidatus Kaiserbacteria bacterium]|nr:hypothetical protein [Candidatus Kaiserbacteria bacterium]